MSIENEKAPQAAGQPAEGRETGKALSENDEFVSIPEEETEGGGFGVEDVVRQALPALEGKVRELFDGIERMKTDQVLQLSSEILKAQPDFPAILFIRGRMLMNTDRMKDALACFRRILSLFEETGEIFNIEMLDSVFQQILVLDVDFAPQSFVPDLERYEQFLLQPEADSGELQGYISDTLIMLSMGLGHRWLRRPFRAFMDFLKEHALLTGLHEITLESGHDSVESYEMHDDPAVSAFVLVYCGTISKASQDDQQLELAGEESFQQKYSYRSPEERNHNQNARLVYEWYMTRYYPGHTEELDYVKEHYPYSWQYIEACIQAASADPAFADHLVDHLMERAQQSGVSPSREEMVQELEEKYQKAISLPKEPLDDEVGPGAVKIGRNDPCPCGSGKKFKNCCGRR